MRFNKIILLLLSLLLSALVFSGVEGCVPSPTATPPRATPFPTLALPTGTEVTPEPTLRATSVPGATETEFPITAAPSPAAPNTPASAPPTSALHTINSSATDRFPPVVQLLAQNPGTLQGLNHPVTMSILGADDVGLARFDFFDNGLLWTTIPAPQPAPRTFATTVTWTPASRGKHTLRVIAYDLAGHASNISETQFNVLTLNFQPRAQIMLPLGTKEVPVGTPLQIQGVASDDVTITRLDLLVDGQLYTSVKTDGREGTTPFAATFWWTPPHLGIFDITLRAHDNEDETGESARLVVHAYALDPPVVSAAYDPLQVSINDTVLVNALALSAGGLTRIELWADNTLVQTIVSAGPDTQVVLRAQLVWAPNAEGEHGLFVRAYDIVGSTTDTPSQIIRVSGASTRVPITPEPTATVPPTVTPVPPTATPGLVPPALPIAQVTLKGDPLDQSLPGPLHLHLSARGSVELQSAELYATYAGQNTPQFLIADSASGATDKQLDFDWTPPRAGVVTISARVLDSAGQLAQVLPLTVYINPPAAPTPTPALFDLAQTWQANLPTVKYTAVLTQNGEALRGSFIESAAAGAPSAGLITNGSVKDKHIFFHVEFAESAHTLEFDCQSDRAQSELDCNYQTERGDLGSAVFTTSPTP